MARLYNSLIQKRHDVEQARAARVAPLKTKAATLLEAALAEADSSLAATKRADADKLIAQVETINLAATEEIEGLDRDIARAKALQDDEKRQGRELLDRIEVGDDRATARAWGIAVPASASAAEKTLARQVALGEFAIAVKNAASGEGQDPRLYAAATGMGTAIPSDGGFAVPTEVSLGIERTMFESGDILSRVDARTISGNAMAYNVLDETSRVDGSRQGGVLGYWVDEGSAPTASQIKIARMELKLRKVGTLGYMTDELVADAAALGGELENAFSNELIFQVEQAIVAGNGAAKPLGFTVAPCLVTVSKVSGQSAATLKTRNLSDMWARLPARSQKTAVWLVNVDTQPEIDELVNPAGTAGVAPRFVNYDQSGVLTIKGRPVISVEYAATLGTVTDVCLVDLSQYRLIRKGGVEQASSMHVRFTSGEQTFRAFYRVDGQPVPRSAITPYKGSKTLSPFVVLETR